MSFNWINVEDYTSDIFLLMDRWLIRYIVHHYEGHQNLDENLGIILAYNPTVAWYFGKRAPETMEKRDRLIANAPKGLTEKEVRLAEDFVFDVLDWAIVLVDPDVMNSNCNYIYNWDKDRLLELADFNDKVVLDVGSGTGRLAFAVAPLAKHVYASEPVDMLREYMRDKIKKERITNVTVVDGTVERIPYPDDMFDIVMSGHVVGDDYETELAELTRVVRNGGYIIDCPGDDDFKRKGPDSELLKRGFEYFYHKSSLGGDIYRYRKEVMK